MAFFFFVNILLVYGYTNKRNVNNSSYNNPKQQTSSAITQYYV